MSAELTEEELAMAKSFAMSPEAYAAYRSSEGAAQWVAGDGRPRRA